MSPRTTTSFTLSPDDPSNATIYDAGGRALYTVSKRRRWAGTTTYVMNVNGAALASLEERDLLPNRVILGMNPSIPLRNWLHMRRGDLSANAYASFKDQLGRKYKWRGCAPGNGSLSTLELYTKDDDYAEPIARFDRPRRRFEPSPHYSSADKGSDPEPARLVLAGRALEIRDMVVISFLFLERARRKTESLEKSTTEALSMLPIAATTYGWNK